MPVTRAAKRQVVVVAVVVVVVAVQDATLVVMGALAAQGAENQDADPMEILAPVVLVVSSMGERVRLVARDKMVAPGAQGIRALRLRVFLRPFLVAPGVMAALGEMVALRVMEVVVVLAGRQTPMLLQGAQVVEVGALADLLRGVHLMLPPLYIEAVGGLVAMGKALALQARVVAAVGLMEVPEVM
jgi:hypothetical protein